MSSCSTHPFFSKLWVLGVILPSSAVISGGVIVLATLVSIFTVDKFGRRILFLEGGCQMFISQIAVGIMIALTFGVKGVGSFSKGEANFLLFLICVYVAAFAWPWGPLGWLVPSEICPLEVISAGQAINVAVNMFFTFCIAQIFLSVLCNLKFGLFFFFAGFVLIMTIFIFSLLPVTKGVPIGNFVVSCYNLENKLSRFC